jgi:hypothetical protein
MTKMISVLAFVLLVAGCKQNSQQQDAEFASASKGASLSIECVRSSDNGRAVSMRDHMKVDIKGNEVSFRRILLVTSGDKTESVHESFKGIINSVFDFNSISKNTVRVLLNPLTLTKVNVDSRDKTESKLPYVLVQYANGDLKITERDAKKLFTHSNCRSN